MADIAALSDIAHAAGLPLVVDATLATPHLCRPFEHGADVVVHSATKFIGGHGTSIGGVLIERGTFDWSSGRFPGMTEPVASYGGLRFWENFAEYGFCTKVRVEQLRDFGTCLSPFNAFLLLQGLETLALRMDAHVANARAVARAPRRSSRSVMGVVRRGFPRRPATAWRSDTCLAAPGAVFAFGVRGGRDAARAFIESVELCSHLANIGDTRTLVIHPALHDAPAALGRRARRRRRAPGHGPHLGRASKTSTTSSGTSTGPSPPRQRQSPERALAAAVGARTPGDPRSHENGRDGRRVLEPSASEPLRRDVPTQLQHRLRGVVRQPA